MNQDKPSVIGWQAWCEELEEEVARLREEVKKKVIPKKIGGLPFNLPLELEDGRVLLIRKRKGTLLEARQKSGRALEMHEIVRTVPGMDGRKAVLRAIRRTKKNLYFRILGGYDADVDRSREKMGDTAIEEKRETGERSE